jgi:threonine synthase
VIQAFREAVALGAMDRMPRVHAVQTEGAYPLKRAFDRVIERVGEGAARDALAYAAMHRSEFMWPWEREPRSIAHGILDDETYDWRAVVAGMVETGGHPVVVDEATVVEAYALARQTTGIDVDHTGSAGLAGLLALQRQAAIESTERVSVLFTGVRREGSI